MVDSYKVDIVEEEALQEVLDTADKEDHHLVDIGDSHRNQDSLEGGNHPVAGLG